MYSYYLEIIRDDHIFSSLFVSVMNENEDYAAQIYFPLVLNMIFY